VCGMVMVQRDEERGHNTSTDGAQTGETLRGIVAVFIAACTSGFAGAYLEKMYTQASGATKRSVWFRNTQLACFSLPVAMIGSAWRDGERLRERKPFSRVRRRRDARRRGTSHRGLVVAAVLRHAGNVLKCFAVSISICTCAVATTLFSDNGHSLSASALVGVALVIGSTFLYSNVV